MIKICIATEYIHERGGSRRVAVAPAQRLASSLVLLVLVH